MPDKILFVIRMDKRPDCTSSSVVQDHSSEKLDVKVRPLREADITTLEEVLTEHVRDLHTGEIVESEVKSILSYMRGAADEVGRIRHYLVASNSNGEPVGCMAISTETRKW